MVEDQDQQNENQQQVQQVQQFQQINTGGSQGGNQSRVQNQGHPGKQSTAKYVIEQLNND